MWDCQLCGQEVMEARVLWCQECNAIPFCSKRCYKRACRSYCHPVAECVRMRKQLEDEMERSAMEVGKPLLRIESCNTQYTCDVLELLSIHIVYPFDALCPCQAKSGTGVP